MDRIDTINDLTLTFQEGIVTYACQSFYEIFICHSVRLVYHFTSDNPARKNRAIHEGCRLLVGSKKSGIKFERTIA